MKCKTIEMSIVVAVGLSAMGAASSMADTIYAYTGNDFDNVSGTYTTSDFVSGTIDLATPLGDSASDVTIPASNIVSFSFSDGVQTITNSTTSFERSFSQFSTSSTGVPIKWDIVLELSSGATITTCGGVSSCSLLIAKVDEGDDAFGDGGEIASDPGAWTVATTTPLPAALPLFAGGLGAMGLLGWRRKKKRAMLAA